MSSERASEDAYQLVAGLPAELTADDLARCFALLDEGKAVDVETARRDLPRSLLVVVVRNDGKIVALGANKGVRRWYAEKVSIESHFAFPLDTQELGYVTVDIDHRNHHLASRIVEALSASGNDP